MSTSRDFAQPRHPVAYFSPTCRDGSSGSSSSRSDMPIVSPSPSEPPRCGPIRSHCIEQAAQWVAVQFGARGPVLVLHDDGTVTERYTMPGDVAHLPVGGAA